MTSVVSAFNDHFMEMVDDIVNVFPDDLDILSARNSLKALRKINPKMLIRSWDFYVVSKYYKEIESGDLSYFLNKDYTQDVSVSSDSKRIIEAINRLRNPIKSMSEEEQKKILKYLQNLSKLTMVFKQTDGK
tara:strand:+ start:13298 stop:13693 length:396 start_codon:yes stop_codon:yes gene_type:complete